MNKKGKNVKNEIKFLRGRLHFFHSLQSDIFLHFTSFYCTLFFLHCTEQYQFHDYYLFMTLTRFKRGKKQLFFMMSPLTLLRACLVATDEALNRLFIYTYIEYRKAGGRWELRSAKVKHTLEYEDENIINLLFATRYREVVLL